MWSASAFAAHESIKDERNHECSSSRCTFTRTTNYCHQDFRGRSAFCPSDVQKENTSKLHLSPWRRCRCSAPPSGMRPVLAVDVRADVLVVVVHVHA